MGDSTKCTGCRACETGLLYVHNRESNHVGKTVGTVSVPVAPRLFLTKFEEGCMPIQCKHCEGRSLSERLYKGSDQPHRPSGDRGRGEMHRLQRLYAGMSFRRHRAASLRKGWKAVAQPMERKPRFSLPSAISARIEGRSRLCPRLSHQALRLVDPEAEREEKTLRRQKLCSDENWR